MRKNFGAKAFSYPQPVFIIATYNEDGSADAMNAAWGGISATTELSVCRSEGHKTVKTLLRTGASTVSMGDAKHVAACDYVGIASGNNTRDKLAKAGFTVSKSESVDAPVINEFTICLECRCNEYQNNEYGCGVIGKVVNVTADESVMGDGKIDMSKVNAIAFDPYTHGYYKVTERVGEAFRDGLKLKK